MPEQPTAREATASVRAALFAAAEHINHSDKGSADYRAGWRDALEAVARDPALATPPPVPAAPPTEGDEQRRCWQILGPEPISQCALYNGHDGDHWFGEAVPAAPGLDDPLDVNGPETN